MAVDESRDSDTCKAPASGSLAGVAAIAHPCDLHFQKVSYRPYECPQAGTLAHDLWITSRKDLLHNGGWFHATISSSLYVDGGQACFPAHCMRGIAYLNASALHHWCEGGAC